MKKYFNIALFLGIIGFCGSALCAANFIVQPSKGGAKTNTIPTINMCAKRGFNRSSCPEGSTPNQRCSSGGKTYYDKCCKDEIYKYASSVSCVNEGLKPGERCGNKWSCVEP